MLRNHVLRTIRLLAAASVITVGLSAQQIHAAARPHLIVSYWDHAAPTQATVIATQPSLSKLIPASITWIPIEASPPAIAAMRSGAFDILTDVGNPPTVSGIANGSDITVVFLDALDYVKLVVKPSIKTADDLAGKTVSDLIGSSEDYAFRGWLKVNNLTSKVTVLSLSGMETPVAAFKAGRIDGAYVDNAQAEELVAAGGHVLVDSARIAKLGYAGTDVILVRTPFLKAHPDIVQGYVNAVVAATRLIEGPNRAARDAAFKTAASITGQPVDQAIASGEAQIGTAFVPLKDELSYFYGPDKTVASGGLATNYLHTVDFLLQGGRIHHAVTPQDIVPHIDPSFAQKALSAGN